MNKLLLTLGTLLVALLTALFAVPAMVDWNDFKGILEEEASRALGREVRVAGRVDLSILPVPYVRFENVTVADARGITGAPFVEARSFKLWLSVPPLLRGALEARRVELDQAELRLRVAADGGGNWQTLQIDPALATWLPSEVAFQSVQFSKSRITIEGPERHRIAVLDDISGELSAPALAGPFKFIGSVGAGADARAVRLTLSERDAAGRSRLRAQLDNDGDGASGNGTLTVDAVLEDTASRPKLSGTLAMTTRAKGEGAISGFELKSNLIADAFGATFADLSVAFEQDGRPQLLAGDAKAAWRDGATLDARLASRWLDLDRISGSAPSSGPLAALDRLTGVFGASGTARGRVRLALAIDHATLAGDVVSSADLVVRLAEGRRYVESLRATLPGGTQAHAVGELVAQGGANGFDGRLLVEGASRTRFLAWAGKGAAPLLSAEARDGAFLFDGKVTTSQDLVAVTDARVALEGAPITVSMSLRRGAGQPFLDVAVKGRRLDLAGVAAGSLAPDAIVAWLASRGFGVATPQTTRLSARLEEVSDGTTTLKNVDLDVALEAGSLDVRRLSVELGDDGQVALSGRLVGLGERLAGTLEGVFAAAGRAGCERLASYVAAIVGDRVIPERLPDGAVKLAWRARLSRSGETAPSRVEADGVIGRDKLRIELESAGPITNWRRQPITAQATFTAADAVRTLAEMAGTMPVPATTATSAEASAGSLVADSLVVSAAGQPDRGVRLHAALALAGARVDVDGTARFGAADRVGFDGTAAVAADQVGTLVAAYYPRLAERLAAVPFTGRLRIRRDDAGWHAEGGELGLGTLGLSTSLDIRTAPTTKAGGAVAVGAGANVSRSIVSVTGRVDASAVSLPALVALVTTPALDVASNNRSDTTSGATSDTGPAKVDSGLWSAQPFALDSLPGVSLALTVTARRLELTEGLAAGPARLTATLADGRASLALLETEVLGGKLSGEVTLSAHAAGADAVARFALAGGALDRLGRGDGKGAVSAQLALRGTALSPRALAVALKGDGIVELTGVALGGIATDAIEVSGNAALSAQGTPKPIEDLLGAALDAGTLVIGDRKLEVVVGDGAARLAAFTVEGPGGRAVNRVTIDLAAFAMESDWRLESRPLTNAAGVLAGRVLPAVQLIYVGPLGGAGVLPRRIGAEGLARELTVLKMERDVRELERIRREDEERVRAEQERQRLATEARVKAAEEARRRALEPPSPAQPLAGDGARPAAAPAVIVPAPGALPAKPTAAGALPPSPSTVAPVQQGSTTPGTQPQGAVRAPARREKWSPFEDKR